MTPTAPRQLLLDLGGPPKPTLANFIPGRNAELVHALSALSDPDPPERFIYLWGADGSGRSHLLRAISSGERARYYACKGDAPGSESLEAQARLRDPAILLWAIDDVNEASPAEQTALFHRINE